MQASRPNEMHGNKADNLLPLSLDKTTVRHQGRRRVLWILGWSFLVLALLAAVTFGITFAVFAGNGSLGKNSANKSDGDEEGWIQTAFNPATGECSRAAGVTCDSSVDAQCAGFSSLQECGNCCMKCRVNERATTQVSDNSSNNPIYVGVNCASNGEPRSIIVEGRPYVDRRTGRTVVASLTSAPQLNRPRHLGGSSQSVYAQAMHEATRWKAADAWELAAQSEHASVASFSRHLLELMAVGGVPPGILEGAATAAADEVRHTSVSLKVASLLRQSSEADSKVPGPLMPLVGDVPSLSDLAIAVMREGCIEETVSAAMAVASVYASNSDLGEEGPALAAAQAAVRDIAREESAHSQLAWETLRWALLQGGAELRKTMSGQLTKLKQQKSTDVGALPLTLTPTYGLITSLADKKAVRQVVLQRLVVPWLEMLLRDKDVMGQQLHADGERVGRGGAMRSALESALGLLSASTSDTGETSGMAVGLGTRTASKIRLEKPQLLAPVYSGTEL